MSFLLQRAAGGCKAVGKKLYTGLGAAGLNSEGTVRRTEPDRYSRM